MLWGLVAVVILVWAVIAVLLSVVIGRAVHIAEIDRGDSEFIRSLSTYTPPSTREIVAG
ncbi:hypothetical protein ACFSBZ_14300 [Amnibacterium flavum]|uniref:hypothetical protein n=1 Tax=Amnibacterium flavum TaxID=2173173 RepID=UPI001403F2E2|nr:hypothetical protein [Amnibacterium flavum]